MLQILNTPSMEQALDLPGVHPSPSDTRVSYWGIWGAYHFLPTWSNGRDLLNMADEHGILWNVKMTKDLQTL